MNKQELSERDICTKFITPALRRAGWDELTQLREEVTFTKGRVIVRSPHGQPRQGQARRLRPLFQAEYPARRHRSAVTGFMADRIDPRPGEVLLDPACGTGGFLTCSIRHMRERYVKTPEDRQQMEAGLRASEKKQLPHMLCVTNMLLHGISDPSFETQLAAAQTESSRLLEAVLRRALEGSGATTREPVAH